MWGLGVGFEQTYIVQKPDKANNEEPESVVFENERVWCLGIPHRVATELLGLLQLKSYNEENQREDNTDAETCAPDGFVVLVLSCSGDNIYMRVSVMV
jgi:hypothetical protein